MSDASGDHSAPALVTTPGTISWADLTVPDAAAVRDFYQQVVGWSASDVEMGGYQDYCMLPAAGGAPAAGICHARGVNAALPPQWMVYVNVADLDASLAACTDGGGTVVVPPNAPAGRARYAIIRDPAGAVCGLFQPAAPAPTPATSAPA